MSAGAPRDATSFEVLEALREPGCAICRVTLQSVTRLIRSISYEQVNDVGVRDELRRARGFCNDHAYQWLRDARSVLGTALIYRDLLQTTLRDLDDRRGPRKLATCIACRAQLEAEGRYVEALLGLVAADDAALAGLDSSDGLCRRHTLAAIRRGGAGAERVAARTRRAIEELTRDLDEVIRKEDYRFRHESRTDAERSAPGRAIGLVAGAAGLVSGASATER